jgi:hypothetical protein
MKRTRLIALGAIVLPLILLGAERALAHCDGLDGPVVKAAQRALATKNVNYVLVWVPRESEAELKSVFTQALAVREKSAESKALADRQLFETLVRLHRAGEGASYTGLKPAGRDLGPAIPAADKALESGQLDAVETLLVSELRRGLKERFTHLQSKRNYSPDDVTAGREFVKAYVEYIHFVERTHEAVTRSSEGHYGETDAH